MNSQLTFGIVVGSRGFFPAHLARSGREEMIRALEGAGIKPLVLGTEDTQHGAVETREEAKKCAALFRPTATRSTASSSRCPISATSAPWPRPCGSPA